MTITRQWTLTAERQTVDDLLSFTATTVPTTSSTLARTGTYSYKFVTTGAAIGRSVESTDAIRAGYWFNHGGVAAAGAAGLFVIGSGTDNDQSPLIFVIWDGTSNEIRVRRATGNDTFETLDSVAAPASLIATSNWVHVAITYYAHATLGFLTVYINGTDVLTLTGDTRLSYWNGVAGGGSAQLFSTAITTVWAGGRIATSGYGSTAWDTTDNYLDDFYCDSYASESDVPVPMRRYLERIANGAGVDAEWTPLASTNVSQIDDGQPNGGANDGDTTYNKAEAANLRDTFTFDDITIPDGYRVVGVIPYVHAKKLDAGPQISLHLWDGSQYADSATLEVEADYTVETFYRFEEMPDTSAFDEAGVNGLEIGYMSLGTYT
jgi:hypothetical protein